MSSTPSHGDDVPAWVLLELVEAIESERCHIPRPVWEAASSYARSYLDMDFPTPTAIWDYLLDRLRHSTVWRYASLEDYHPAMGYFLRNADGRGLFLKLRFDDDSWVILMSFHD